MRMSKAASLFQTVLAALLALGATSTFADTYICAGDSIRVFADDASLGSSPIRIISGPTTGMTECYAIALDNKHGELWVTAQNAIRAFAARANGDATALRTITNSNIFAVGLAIDVEADEVYVGSSSGGIFVYPRTGNGSPAPLRTIQGDQTTLNTVVGLFVDRVNNELYAVNYNGNVAVFARTANGNVGPLRPFVSATNPFGLVVDAHANEVFLATGTGYIQVYDRSGAALRTIDGTAFGLTQTAGLALRNDATMLVGNQYHSATTQDNVLVLSRTPNGSASLVSNINFAAPLQRSAWGVASSHAFECGEGQTTSSCVFRSGFE